MFSINSLVIALLILSVASIAVSSICLVTMHSMKDIIKSQSNIIYTMMKKQSNADENISKISTDIDSIDDTITSLSTSIRDIIREARSVANEDMMPTPQLAEMISATIKEQILIEFNLSKNMRIPRADSTKKIIENTVRTYQYVDKEYITKKCLSMIESMLSEK